MELLEVINKRRTVRDFSEKEVPFEIIERSLEAGLRAPSYIYTSKHSGSKRCS